MKKPINTLMLKLEGDEVNEQTINNAIFFREKDGYRLKDIKVLSERCILLWFVSKGLYLGVE